MLYIIIAVLTVLVDQLTKYLYASVYNAPTVTLIDRILGLEYVENKGAAWGIFADNQIALYIISAIMTVGMIVCFVIFYKRMSKLLRIALALIIAGAIGNMIDRFCLGYVRDMIAFLFIDFPVFNVADAAITCGGALMIVDVIFFKEKDLNDSIDSGDHA